MITLTQDSAAASTRRGGNGGAVAEQYYALAHWLRPAPESTGSGSDAAAAKSIGITSCVRGAGVSTVAANLAIAAARTSDRPVLLVNLSGRKSPLAGELAVASDSGLGAVLSGQAQPKERVVQTRVTNLSYLGSNDLPHSPLLSIEGGRVVQVIRELECDFGLLVIDLPPTDSGLCFSTVGTLDGVLLVMDGQRTQSAPAARAKQRLIHANAAVLGIILNQHTRDLPRWLDARL